MHSDDGAGVGAGAVPFVGCFAGVGGFGVGVRMCGAAGGECVSVEVVRLVVLGVEVLLLGVLVVLALGLASSVVPSNSATGSFLSLLPLLLLPALFPSASVPAPFLLPGW